MDTESQHEFTTWQGMFRHWIVVTQEKIDFWDVKNSYILTAKEHMRKEGINFEKVFLEKWKAQIRAWQADLDADRASRQDAEFSKRP